MSVLNCKLGKQTTRDTCINLINPSLNLWHFTFFAQFVFYFYLSGVEKSFLIIVDIFFNVQEFKHLLKNLKIRPLELIWHYQPLLFFQDFQALLEGLLLLNINTLRYYFKNET